MVRLEERIFSDADRLGLFFIPRFRNDSEPLFPSLFHVFQTMASPFWVSVCMTRLAWFNRFGLVGSYTFKGIVQKLLTLCQCFLAFLLKKMPRRRGLRYSAGQSGTSAYWRRQPFILS